MMRLQGWRGERHDQLFGGGTWVLSQSSCKQNSDWQATTTTAINHHTDFRHKTSKRKKNWPFKQMQIDGDEFY